MPIQHRLFDEKIKQGIFDYRLDGKLHSRALIVVE